MVDVKLLIYRNRKFNETPDEAQQAHIQRAKLIHGLVDTLDLEVKKWGNTDRKEPSEGVEVIIALGSAGVFTAMVKIFQLWIEKNKIMDIDLTIKPPGKPEIILKAKQITESQLQNTLKIAMGLS